MKIPTLAEAEKLLEEAEARNPGPWVAHSRYVALAAQNIAEVCPELNAENAYILGLVYDIGRQEGVTGHRHILDGFVFLEDLGYSDAARVALTHSYPLQDIGAGSGVWDGTDKELAFVETYLMGVEYNNYDRLLQLSDALAISSGFVLVEKRLLDVSVRYGIDEFTVPKWEAFLGLRYYFEKAIGRSVYSVLPGVVENTFGFTP